MLALMSCSVRRQIPDCHASCQGTRRCKVLTKWAKQANNITQNGA